jgi:hypothetical protein
MENIAVIVGNDTDGWNVEVTLYAHKITCACEDKSDAEDLCAVLNRCSCFSVSRA